MGGLYEYLPAPPFWAIFDVLIVVAVWKLASWYRSRKHGGESDQ